MEQLLLGFDIKEVVGNTFYFLLILIAFDVLTGLLAAAKEKKINSSISFDGMIKKIGEIIGLVFITLVDAYFEANGVIVKMGAGMIIVYEGISIIENFSRIGIDMTFLTKYFDKNKIGGDK